MNKKYSSQLLLSRDDFSFSFDYRYKWFLPCLILFIVLFAIFSPLLKGVGFLPIFLILTVVFVAFLLWFLYLNKQIKAEIVAATDKNELFSLNADFYDDKLIINQNGKEETVKYKNIIKIEEYETLYFIYTNNRRHPIAISKDVANLKDGSDFLDFIANTIKPKRKRVKKVGFRKQKALITVIVLGVFAFSSLMPLIYLFAYNLFDYSRFGIR